jgi:glutamate-ammonia-ligase adenylyltransferase
LPSPSDLFLSPDLTEEQAREYLASLGFRDAAMVDTHLQAMAEEMAVREALGRLASELLPSLLESPDPDAAVIGVSRYLAARTGRSMFLDYLHDDPRALHVLTYVFGASPLLGEMLVRNPESFHWLISQFERSAPDRRDLEDEIRLELSTVTDPGEAIDTVKRWHRRETLRIAARDLMRRETVESAAAQISDLAAVVIDTALSIVTRQLLAEERRDRAPGTFAVVGMGKLGGRELNYGSDIDLVYVYAPLDNDQASRDFFHRLGGELTGALTKYTGESALYRVGLPLGPDGARGNTAHAIDEYGEHELSRHEMLERLALMKASAVAGDLPLGQRFVDRLQPFIYGPDRGAIEELLRSKAPTEKRDVKDGPHGVREIELLTQLLQLRHGGENIAVRQPGTLAALEALARAGLLAKGVQRELNHAYVSLRSIEHRIQLVQENQTYLMPEDPDELEMTARRVGLGSSGDLQKQLNAHRDRVNEIFRGLLDSTAQDDRLG